MLRSLIEWGIQRFQDTESKKFCKEMMNCVESYYNCEGKAIDECNISNKDLPKSIKKAIRYILILEICKKVDDIRIIEDKLLRGNNVDLSGIPPFFYTPSSRVQCTMRREYEQFRNASLDPFQRFSATEVSKSEYFFKKWWDKPGLNDTILKAIVAFHAIDKGSCVYCNKTRTLFWTGSENNGLWGNMICVKCKSLYVICPKKSLKEIDDFFKYNKMERCNNSFQEYYQIANYQRNKSKTTFLDVTIKSFIVFVSNNCDFIDTAEIDCVLPCLQDRSFVTRNNKNPFVGSFIRIKENSRVRWFNVPSTNINYEQVATDIFCKFFSLKTYSLLCAYQREQWSNKSKQTKSNDAICQKTPTEDQVDSLDKIRNVLEEINVLDL